jgi:hypothetical protein
MARQTLKPFQWLCVCDGDEPTKTTCNQEFIYCPDFRGNGSMIKKIRFVIEQNLIKGDALVFVEDDDFFSHVWLEFCATQLERYQLMGEGRAFYYNPVKRFWYEHGNMQHASLCSTALRRNLFPLVLGACASENPFLDSRIWRDVIGNKKVFDPNTGKRLVVGMKGMPGRTGYGSGHVVREASARDDLDLAVLKKQIGADAKLYEGFYKP